MPTVFLGLFGLVGLLGTVAVGVDWLQGLETYGWDAASCTIESSAAVARPEYGDHVFEVSYGYRHRGIGYTGSEYRHGYGGSEDLAEARVLASRYQPGDTVPCWVDGDEPAHAYLERANLWRGFLVFVPLLFVAVAAGALWAIHRGPFAGAEGAAEPDRVGIRGRRGSGTAKKARPLKTAFFMAGFFGLFLVFGLGILIPFFVVPSLRVLEARSWTEVPCEILESRVAAHQGDDGTTYSVEALFRYEIGGREYLSDRYGFMGGSSSGYEAKAEIVERLPAGGTIVCWVDPDDPYDAVIERGFTGEYFFGLIPLIFVLVGAGGVAVVVVAVRGAKRDAARPSWAALPGLAAMIGVDEAAPAMHGPIQLEPVRGPIGKLIGVVLIALFWNGFVSIFVWFIVDSWRHGRHEWMPALILTPFVLIGLLLLAAVPYQILALLNPRPRVRLSRGAIPAGGSAEIAWTFRGLPSRIRRLRIWLEGERTVVQRSESSVSSSVEGAGSIEILDRGPEASPEFGAASFTLPRGTRPTDGSGDRRLRWKLKLHGTIAYWPDVHEEYEIQILPPDG